MGLAGCKVKQRIGADPRNLSWSNDSSKFGAKYLQSLGWVAGSGLGASGEGRVSNLTVHQKLDLLGIGANRRGAPDADWKLGRQFDGLLARLNQAQNADASLAGNEEPEGEGANAHLRSQKHDTEEALGGVEGAATEMVADSKEGTGRTEAGERRKRKKVAEEDNEEANKAARHKKAEKKRERKESKRAEKESKKISGTNSEAVQCTAEEMRVGGSMKATVSKPLMKVTPPYRAHRAKYIQSKRLAATSTTSMNEILGIASSSLPEKIQDQSSIPLRTIVIPPKLQPGGIAPKVPLTRVHTRTQSPPPDACRTSTMGLGAHSSLSGGAGSGGVLETSTDSVDHLFRKNGKSVAEYFAEKLRPKPVGKDGNNSLKDDKAICAIQSEALSKKREKS